MRLKWVEASAPKIQLDEAPFIKVPLASGPEARLAATIEGITQKAALKEEEPDEEPEPLAFKIDEKARKGREERSRRAEERRPETLRNLGKASVEIAEAKGDVTRIAAENLRKEQEGARLLRNAGEIGASLLAAKKPTG